ncbi:MAG: DUF2807 domain-containing protein [Bacteroidales bacterium]|nr:DUF2807 domain-containing protein [Bacteroidales bacterium]
MKATKPILILCVAALFATSCKKEVDMTIMQKTLFENADIREIEASDGWQVTIVADSCTFVELTYSAYLEPYLKARMNDTRLELSFMYKTFPSISSEFHATVHMRQLEKIDAKTASTIIFTGSYEGERLCLNLSGGSVCNTLTYSGDKCEIEMDAASKLLNFQFDGRICTASLNKSSQFNGKIYATELLDLNLYDNSRFINRGGETARADIKLHGGSLLNMVETQVSRMYIELSEASEATVWVAEYLRAILHDASTLYYKGNPLKDLACHDNSEVKPL